MHYEAVPLARESWQVAPGPGSGTARRSTPGRALSARLLCPPRTCPECAPALSEVSLLHSLSGSLLALCLDGVQENQSVVQTTAFPYQEVTVSASSGRARDSQSPAGLSPSSGGRRAVERVSGQDESRRQAGEGEATARGLRRSGGQTRCAQELFKTTGTTEAAACGPGLPRRGGIRGP